MAKTWTKTKSDLKNKSSPKRTPKRIIWWGVKGVIYWELLPDKVTLNAMKYRQKLNKLEAEIINKGLFKVKLYFPHDNAKPNLATVFSIRHHPPYLPELSPSEYHLFRSLRGGLEDRKF